ncbi:DMT family transporter [Microbaculum marinum]|uniref:DMT family transporter n=1 Tax=Microbaculum marinum TaxID=1764581 RepID=A0AAW9RSB2_9HYPH
MVEVRTADAAASLRPAMVVALSILLLSAMDALVKSMGPTYPILQLVWLRYVFGAVFAVAAFAATGPHTINLKSIKTNALRAAIMIVAAGSFFFAITRMPLVEAVTLSFTAPIFMVLIARIVLGEPITSRAIFGVMIGFAGVLVVVAGDMGTGRTLMPLGVAAALLAAVSYALGIILLRKHSAHDAIPVMVLLQAAFATLMLTPFGLVAWSGVSMAELGRFVVIGLLGTVGHLLIAWGFKHAEAGKLAPLEYTNLLWATIFGVLFFSERPAMTTLAGAMLIILACLIATRSGRPIFPRRRINAPGS